MSLCLPDRDIGIYGEWPAGCFPPEAQAPSGLPSATPMSVPPTQTAETAETSTLPTINPPLNTQPTPIQSSKMIKERRFVSTPTNLPSHKKEVSIKLPFTFKLEVLADMIIECGSSESHETDLPNSSSISDSWARPATRITKSFGVSIKFSPSRSIGPPTTPVARFSPSSIWDPQISYCQRAVQLPTDHPTF